MAKAPERDAPPRRATAAGNLLRIAAGFALLGLLYYWRIIDLAALRVLFARPEILALALAGALANIPLEALRWHVLLRAQGLELRLLRTTRILASSVFFANFLPGAAGGDLIRGVYIYKAAQGHRTSGLLSILIDRLLGLVAFVLLGLGAMLTRPGTVASAYELAILGLSLGFIAALVASLFAGHRIALGLQRLLSGRSARLARIIEDTGAALRQYARDPRSMGLALLLSAVIVGFAVGPIVLIAEAMPFAGPSALDYGIAGLYALIANSLPVTPGGLGIGEGAFASACLVLAPQAARAAYGTIFLAFRCVFILSTLPGLAAYLISL
ncbi:MAG TPA: lysylphosphatidylglycerol synthase transmembrane domain-containing protein [Stellaceae bacterium]|nr:lysylphosphatidylglycerol synthase transmembrane domain-containing protein [Stellaceae bacterium]